MYGYEEGRNGKQRYGRTANVRNSTGVLFLEIPSLVSDERILSPENSLGIINHS